MLLKTKQSFDCLAGVAPCSLCFLINNTSMPFRRNSAFFKFATDTKDYVNSSIHQRTIRRFESSGRLDTSVFIVLSAEQCPGTEVLWFLRGLYCELVHQVNNHRDQGFDAQQYIWTKFFLKVQWNHQYMNHHFSPTHRNATWWFFFNDFKPMTTTITKPEVLCRGNSEKSKK